MACLISALSLSACSPDQNWRDVALDGTAFKAQLPCKPDRTTRPVNMGGLSLSLQVVGCESAGAMWAVMTTELPAGADAPGLISGWQKATLQNLSTPARRRPPRGNVATCCLWRRPCAFKPRVKRPGQEVMLTRLGAVAAGDRVADPCGGLCPDCPVANTCLI
jgi:hypothetical protein